MPLTLKRYQKKSPYWYIRGTVKGVELNESSGTTDKAQAEHIKNERERELLELGPAALLKPSFTDAIENYAGLGKSLRFINPLFNHFKNKPLSDIGQQEIDEAARTIHPNNKISTRRRNVYVPMKAILNAAATAGLCEYKRISTPSFTQPVIRGAEPEHIERLLRHSSPRLKAYITFITYTGARTGEALALEQSDLNLKQGEAYLRHTKNGEPRLVALAAPVIEAIQELPEIPHPRVFQMRWVKTAQNDLAKAEKAAKLPHRTFHQLGRHAFAERLLALGHTIKEVKEAGGWKSIEIVDRRYGHLERGRVHDIVRNAAVNQRREKG